MLFYLGCLACGAVAGICAGLFGVGGGLIIVPMLIGLLGLFGQSDLVHLAVGTSLATIIPTSIGSSFAHHKAGNVRFDVAFLMAPGLFLGALLGAYVAHFIAAQALQGAIAVCAVLVGVRMLLAKQNLSTHAFCFSRARGGLGGLSIGLVSALFGIGGGSMTVPFLTTSGLGIKQAVGTSAFCGFFIAVAGALGFMLFGQGAEGMTGAVGSVHLGAFLCISLASFFFAKVGARVAHLLPPIVLKRAFGVLLVCMGMIMAFGA